MTAYSLVSQDSSASHESAAPLQRCMERRRSSLDDTLFKNHPSNHQTPMCWSCFLPIFGNRPGLFEGDLALCVAEDDEELICQNISDQTMPDSNLLHCRSDVSVRDDNCNIPTAFTSKGKDSPLVTMPSPVSMHIDDNAIQQKQEPEFIPTTDNWDDEEAPELIFSGGEDESFTGYSGSHYFDGLEGNERYSGDILNCNIVGGIEIQAVLQQGGMEIPFAATIPFPRARNARYNGLEARPFSAGSDITVLGKIQVGVQKFSFQSTSAVQ